MNRPGRRGPHRPRPVHDPVLGPPERTPGRFTQQESAQFGNRPPLAFGGARIVFNDAMRAREDARAAGQPFPTAGLLSTRLITQAKQTPERALAR